MRLSEDSLLPDLTIRELRPHGQKIDPNGYKIVSVRLREAEYEAFSQQVRALNLTNNMALRIAARRIAGFLEIDADTRHMLSQVTHHIGTIAEGLMRLSATAAKEKSVDVAQLAKLRAAFSQDFARLDGFIRIILNVSLRRQDGRSLLVKAGKGDAVE